MINISRLQIYEITYYFPFFNKIIFVLLIVFFKHFQVCVVSVGKYNAYGFK